MINSLELNLTELCNLTCGFCPRGSQEKPYPNQNLNMSLDTVKLIVEQALEFDSNIVFFLSGRGEPTLHPKLDKVIDIIHSNNFEVGLSTNGHRFDKFKHSIEKCSYIVYDVYSENNEDFLDAISKLKDSKIEHKRVDMKNEDGFCTYEWYNGEYVLNSPTFFLKNRAGSVDKKYQIERNNSRYCKYIEERLFIDWNGNYNLCCQDWSTKSLGNIHRQNIKTYVEQNVYLQAYKNGIKSGNRLSPCYVCNI